MQFLECTWEGEVMHVAVMESHKTLPWYGGVKEVPQELMGLDIGGNSGLQVLDVSGLDAVVGRIPRLTFRVRQGRRKLISSKEVVFDPSMGRLRA